MKPIEMETAMRQRIEALIRKLEADAYEALVYGIEIDDCLIKKGQDQ